MFWTKLTVRNVSGMWGLEEMVVDVLCLLLGGGSSEEVEADLKPTIRQTTPLILLS